jgi:hypothetical protein
MSKERISSPEEPKRDDTTLPSGALVEDVEKLLDIAEEVSRDDYDDTPPPSDSQRAVSMYGEPLTAAWDGLRDPGDY